MSSNAEGAANNPTTPRQHTRWTDSDQQHYADVAHNIAVAVACGHDPYQTDIDKFRELTRRRDAHLGVAPLFPGEASRGLD